MCYSKEVQLVTGSTILLFCLYYYIYFSIKYHSIKKDWLLPFLRYFIIAFVFIGSHQVFEFLSLATGNQAIYKVGLLLSMAGMLFYLISLEKLYNRNFYAKYFLIGIALVAVYMFSIDMKFSEKSFHLSHESAFIWAAYWLVMFTYFHICAIKDRAYLKQDISKKTVLLFMFAILDFSFLVSAVYAILGYWKFGVNVCTDSPSIWCTFVVLQIFLMPILLFALPKILDKYPVKTSISLKKFLLYLFVSVVIIVGLVLTLPFFNCLAIKFVFP